MNSKKIVLRFVVSLYVGLFVFAIWSLGPSSVMGGATVAGHGEDLQQTASGLRAVTTGTHQGTHVQDKDTPPNFMAIPNDNCQGQGVNDVYLCALLMGAAYN